MSDYLARLANCVLHGIESTPGTKNGQPWKYRNLIRIKVSGFELEFHQDTQLPASFHNLKGVSMHTTNLFVRNVTKQNVPHLVDVISDVCFLLSFATESRVLPYAHEYPFGSGAGGSRAMVGTIQWWRPPFSDPEKVKNFVELCFDTFVKLRNRRKLHVVIDYIHHSVMRGLALEVQIGLACITFENLRHNWAVDAGYPHINGFFKEKNATPANPGSTVGIQRHLTEMFAEVGMNSNPKRIVDTRNEVIHTGLYGNIANSDIHEFLETALREYFLRLVGYHGTFKPYIGGSPQPHLIP
jgi:hypothetical protein